jgi:indolepyruvate ferredoxin oxidoreductase beta subunit
VDASTLAREAGSARAANMVMLGAAEPFIQVSDKHLVAAIQQLFARKGEKVVETNIKAFRAGRKVAEGARKIDKEILRQAKSRKGG